MEKCLFYTLALVGCWLLPIGVQTLKILFLYHYTWGLMEFICLFCVLLFQPYRVTARLFTIPMEERTFFAALWVIFLRDITAFALSSFENFAYMG